MSDPRPPDEILGYYALGGERGRLDAAYFPLELSQRISRTLDLQVVLNDLLRVLRLAVAYDAAGVFVLNRTVPLIRRADPNLIAGMARRNIPCLCYVP